MDVVLRYGNGEMLWKCGNMKTGAPTVSFGLRSATQMGLGAYMTCFVIEASGAYALLW
jgi:hypothetical protein